MILPSTRQSTAPQSRRLRQRHSEHILDLMRDGITMRTIRRHRLVHEPHRHMPERYLVTASMRADTDTNLHKLPIEQC